MMNWMDWHRFPGLGLRTSALLGLALALAILAAHEGSKTVEAAGATPDLAMAIDVDGGGDDCDTRASTAGIGATCNVTVGQQFTLRGHIDKVAGLPGTGGYVVFQYQFLYTNPGLTRNNRAGSGEVGPDAGAGVPNFWEVTTGGADLACAPQGEVDGAGSYYVDCWSSPQTKSSYTGKLVEVDFTCATAGTRTITMDDNGTYVHNQSHGNTPLDTEGDEVLTINCASAVGGIAEQPDVAGTPLEASSGSDSNAWLIATLAGAASAGIVAFGGAAWYARRRSHN